MPRCSHCGSRPRWVASGICLNCGHTFPVDHFDVLEKLLAEEEKDDADSNG